MLARIGRVLKSPKHSRENMVEFKKDWDMLQSRALVHRKHRANPATPAGSRGSDVLDPEIIESAYRAPHSSFLPGAQIISHLAQLTSSSTRTFTLIQRFPPSGTRVFCYDPSLSCAVCLPWPVAVSFFLAFAFAPWLWRSRLTGPHHSRSSRLRLPPAMVIGFVGGFVKHDTSAHSTVQVVEHLRNEYPAGVYVQAFENRRREKAHKEILRRLDLNNDGALSTEEKRNARIIIFGHSWGASETVTLARKLEKEGIPVLLTIQVDSVSKIGQNDASFPPT